jgi:hypothetical protein
MSHEGERATDAGIQDEPERALPPWLNPLVGLPGGHSVNAWGASALRLRKGLMQDQKQTMSQFPNPA